MKPARQAESGNDFEAAAQEKKSTNVVRELWYFIRENRKWWMIPIIGVLFLFGLMMLLAGSGAAPFIYTLF